MFENLADNVLGGLTSASISTLSIVVIVSDCLPGRRYCFSTLPILHIALQFIWVIHNASLC